LRATMATRNDRLQCTWMTSFSGVRVRRNCNVFNLAMENVLKGLPDKIQDQLSRHHTQMHFKSNEMYTFFNHFQIWNSQKWQISIPIFNLCRNFRESWFGFFFYFLRFVTRNPPTKSKISCPDIIHKCTSNPMKCTHFLITFKLRDSGDDR
jgi:hypothetical protein